MADGHDLEREVTRLRDALEAERRISEQWRRVAEERRVAMERLRQRRAVRFVLSVAKVLLPIVRRARGRLHELERRGRRFSSGLAGSRHRLGAGRREAVLRQAVERLPAPVSDPRLVHIVVLTRNGRVYLERLLPCLRALRHGNVVVTVVDNDSGSETADWLREQSDLRVIRNERNLSFAEANNGAVHDVTADAILFLNDDVEPLDDEWLDRMLARLRDDVAVVGAQLVYPRRSLLDGRTRDVSVQHLGISLEPDGDGPPRAVNRSMGSDVDPGLPAREVFGVTAACLLIDAKVLRDLGGFDERYEYGAEDVDLCWRVRVAGHRVVVAPDAVLWHREGATRHRDALPSRTERQERNWGRLADRFGPAMRRAVEADRVQGRLAVSDRPWRVAVTITRDLPSAGYGDWYTAHELGDALSNLGWEVEYIERYRDAWYERTEHLDLIVVLHDEFDVRRVSRPGLTTLAWIRNWADRWVGHPWFEDLDIVTASSRLIADAVVSDSRRRDVPIMPLATNPERFRPGRRDRSGVALTVNNWGVDRGVEDLVAVVDEVALFGKGWEDVPGVQSRWHGHLAYDDLPTLYAEKAIVIDQAAPHTRASGSVNSRVFDALAAGALVVTNQAAGAWELFEDLLPVYEEPSEAAALVRRALAAPEETRRRVAQLQQRVLDEHTYSRRAETVRDLVFDHLRRATVVVRTGAPNRREARNWGDTFYADALVAELRAAGHRAAMQTLDEWESRRGRGFDVSLHLKGRSRCPRSEGQVHAVWVISHPDEVDPNELEVADVAFVASPLLAEHLRERVPHTPIHVLLQATDQRRFRPRTAESQWAHDVVFVGNSRFSDRPLVLAAAEADVGLVVHGANWERYLTPGTLGERFVPNDLVPVVYSSAKVVLNDHWGDMRRWGLVSNRVFDALACGACLVSDDVPGLDELFGDAVATADPSSVGGTLRELLADPERRARMGRRGSALVLDSHTFQHRIDTLLDVVVPLVPSGPALHDGP